MALKVTDFMGAIPAIGGRMKKEDRGFLLGTLPGIMYKQSQKRKDPRVEPATQVAQASKVMKKGGKVSKKKTYKCSHNRLY